MLSLREVMCLLMETVKEFIVIEVVGWLLSRLLRLHAAEQFCVRIIGWSFILGFVLHLGHHDEDECHVLMSQSNVNVVLVTCMKW